MLAKLTDGKIKYAYGRIIKYGEVIVSNPRDEDFIKAGYKPVIDNRLEGKEGYYQVPEYSETEENIIIDYHYEEILYEQETDS